MNNEIEQMDRLRQLVADNAKLAGRMSAMSGYLDSIAIPAVPKIHKRVKLMTILYQQMQVENKRLSLLLNEMGDDDA